MYPLLCIPSSDLTPYQFTSEAQTNFTQWLETIQNISETNKLHFFPPGSVPASYLGETSFTQGYPTIPISYNTYLNWYNTEYEGNNAGAQPAGPGVWFNYWYEGLNKEPIGSIESIKTNFGSQGTYKPIWFSSVAFPGTSQTAQEYNPYGTTDYPYSSVGGDSTYYMESPSGNAALDPTGENLCRYGGGTSWQGYNSYQNYKTCRQSEIHAGCNNPCPYTAQAYNNNPSDPDLINASTLWNQQNSPLPINGTNTCFKEATSSSFRKYYTIDVAYKPVGRWVMLYEAPPGVTRSQSIKVLQEYCKTSTLTQGTSQTMQNAITNGFALANSTTTTSTDNEAFNDGDLTVGQSEAVSFGSTQTHTMTQSNSQAYTRLFTSAYTVQSCTQTSIENSVTIDNTDGSTLYYWGFVWSYQGAADCSPIINYPNLFEEAGFTQNIVASTSNRAPECLPNFFSSGNTPENIQCMPGSINYTATVLTGNLTIITTPSPTNQPTFVPTPFPTSDAPVNPPSPSPTTLSPTLAPFLQNVPSSPPPSPLPPTINTTRVPTPLVVHPRAQVSRAPPQKSASKKRAQNLTIALSVLGGALGVVVLYLARHYLIKRKLIYVYRENRKFMKRRNLTRTARDLSGGFGCSRTARDLIFRGGGPYNYTAPER